ncbi:sensor domain-containing protein [Haloterrigena sp. SYSU A558-1]|uniref:Sensor domain-containing protein n=1 Tax=Haloterrigena gelatinilytica TaxID=2741724 RepID=A0ABX2LGZ9_9EURY|nr:sensor domain-containing protein [Haloterrigena gelatinilytica]
MLNGRKELDVSHRSGRFPPGTARRAVRTAITSPFRPQTYLNLLYLLLAFPLGLLYFVFLVTGVSLGVGLLVILVGAPILLVVFLASHVFAAFERASARYLLAVEIDSPGYPFLDDEGATDGFRSLLLGRETYKAMGFLLAKFAIGTAAFSMLVMLFTTAITLFLTPLYYQNPNVHIGFVTNGDPVQLTPSLQLPWHDLLIGAEFAVTITEWEVTTLPEALATSAVGLVALLLSLAICNGFAWLVGQFSRVLLGPSSRAALEDLQDGLAR